MSLTLRKTISGLVKNLKPSKSEVDLPQNLQNSKSSFLDLPAEIRLSIYEIIADNTELILASPSKKSSKLPTLALTSRQVRSELISTLCKRASIACLVQNFDFRHVQTLMRAHADDLHHNPNLTIQLLVSRSWYEHMERLDDFLNIKTSAVPSISWKYTACPSRGYDVITLQIFHTRGAGLVWRLHTQQDEKMKAELMAMIKALQREADKVTKASLSCAMIRMESNYVPPVNGASL